MVIFEEKSFHLAKIMPEVHGFLTPKLSEKYVCSP
jgi:hypothetical protein